MYVIIDPNNTTFTQRIDDCMGLVMTLFNQKLCKFEMCSVAGASVSAGLRTLVKKKKNPWILTSGLDTVQFGVKVRVWLGNSA